MFSFFRYFFSLSAACDAALFAIILASSLPLLNIIPIDRGPVFSDVRSLFSQDLCCLLRCFLAFNHVAVGAVYFRDDAALVAAVFRIILKAFIIFTV